MKTQSYASVSTLRLERRVARIKREIAQIGAMRPGAIGVQYKDPKRKQGAFCQISYTIGAKSHTRYVRPEHLEALKRETRAYKRFRELTQEWVLVELELSVRRVAQDGSAAKATGHNARTHRNSAGKGEIE